MEKITIDTSDVSEGDFENVETVLIGAVTALGKVSGVKIVIEADDGVVEATSPGK